MATIVILDGPAAQKKTRSVSRKALEQMPTAALELLSPEVIAAAGCKNPAAKNAITVPEAGIRHLAGCKALADSAASLKIDPRMKPHTRTNSVKARRETVPCPTCYAPFFNAMEDRAVKRGKVLLFDAASFRVVVGDKPQPKPAAPARKRKPKAAAPAKS
jgi:hypothetical protein